VPLDKARAKKENIHHISNKGLRSFVNSVSYYCRFISNIVEHTALLTPATAKDARPCVCWSDGMGGAFNHLCNVLCNVWALTIPPHTQVFAAQGCIFAKCGRCPQCPMR